MANSTTNRSRHPHRLPSARRQILHPSRDSATRQRVIDSAIECITEEGFYRASTNAIAERAGLDLRIVADAIATGQAASPQVVRNSQRMLAGNHQQDIVFTPQLRLKDVRYALELARQLEIGSPFGLQAETAFRQLYDLGLQDANESAVLEVARLQTPRQ